MAGNEQEHTGGEELAFGELIALRLCSDQARQQIPLRILAARGDERGEVLSECHSGIAAARDGLRPLLEDGAIGSWHTQHLANDRDWEWIGEVLDEIHRVGVMYAVQ